MDDRRRLRGGEGIPAPEGCKDLPALSTALRRRDEQLGLTKPITAERVAPDGQHIVFTSTRNGSFDLYQKSISHPETEDLILSSPHTKSVTDWSLDGRWLPLS